MEDFAHGHHDRQGAHGPLHPRGSAALHAGGRHHPRGSSCPRPCATASACFSGWSCTRPEELAQIVEPQRPAFWEIPCRPRRCAGNRLPQPRHAPYRQPYAQARARFRAGAWPSGTITDEVARDALNMLDVDELGLDRTDRNMLRHDDGEVRRRPRGTGHAGRHHRRGRCDALRTYTSPT